MMMEVPIQVAADLMPLPPDLAAGNGDISD
jgi:hypothetical protein